MTRIRVATLWALAAALVAGLVGVGIAVAAGGIRLGGAAAREQAFRDYRHAHHIKTGGTPDDSGLLAGAQAYAFERTAPGFLISGKATLAAQAAAQKLPQSGGAWTEVTKQPYNAEPAGYTDPNWSNAVPPPGAGFRLVGGRTTALAATSNGDWFAGTADGGVWRSTNKGATWKAMFDNMPSLSIGALAVNPVDQSLWVGTGEANTSQDSYAGVGIYRSVDYGVTWTRVGDDKYGNNPILSRTVYQIAFDPSGNAYAATNNGLFRYAASTGQWTEVLAPAGPNDFPPYDNQITSVAVVPGTGGQHVITVDGWRGPTNTAFNSFYQSTDGGKTFHPVTPKGAINAADIGRTTFAYAADGSKLYAIVESPSMLAAGAVSNLQGVFVSSGTPASVAGPWTKIADATKLSNSGSANAYGPDSVGAQAWYNQDLAVDPANPNHLYIGLEEVFQSTNGGATWNTASRYWNFGLTCTTSCPYTTHPDQHAMMITGDKLVIGNDGGAYSRALSDTQQGGGWSDLTGDLRSLQYYDARAGKLNGGVQSIGGLQDNGTSVLIPGATQNIEPAGGDGFYVIVHPTNANKFVGEYVYGTSYSTTDGGHTFNSTVSPGCFAQATFLAGGPRPDCDPGFRFVSPLIQDQSTANTWVAGGEFVWVTHAGWDTQCTHQVCTWRRVYDTGAGNAVTAIGSANAGGIIYVGWVAAGGNPGPSFGSGIATNYGGTWHQVSMAGLPNRFIAGMTVDPSNPAHAYAIFNGYSRRWIPAGGNGHVFETTDGGQTWTNISTNLPDVPSDALVMRNGKLALATDLGMFTATAGLGLDTRWSRLGTGLPNVSVNDVTLGPNGTIVAGTHGRGIWSLPFG